MTRFRTAVLASLLAATPGLALAQAPDAAAERARLANERIQAEAERRARDEQEQQDRAAATAQPAQVAPVAPQASAAPARPVTGADLTERGLEQLRELARMKDAGYLTDAEFQRIKQKILDSHF